MFGFDQQLTFTLLFPGCMVSACFSSPPKALCWHLQEHASAVLAGRSWDFLMFKIIHALLCFLLPVEDGRDCSSSGS